jgi:murein DD-endopeptidase MepM/ murein hydrolase activator NlpD
VLKQAMDVKAKSVGLGLFLKLILPFLIVAGILYGTVLMILFFANWFVHDDPESIIGEGIANVSPEVLRYKPTVENYAKEYGVEEYVGIILALMMQESGGRGDDPMQASESYCGQVGCITDPELSIKQGVQYFSQVLQKANGDVKLALQSYNFGQGFIDYVNERGGKYTKTLAIEFSAMMYDKLAHTGHYRCVRPEAIPYGACYGDIGYVDAVLQYYDFTLTVTGNGEWAFPIGGAMDITSPYGWRTWPDGRREFHRGIDFACINYVTPIYSVSDGRVIYAQFHTNRDGTPGYGNLVMVQHGKKLISAYAHMSDITVKEGQTIKKGQQVGVCGNTGHSTGPHLHFEVKSEMWSGQQNPISLFSLKED